MGIDPRSRPPSGDEPDDALLSELLARLRQAREDQNLSLRDLAKRVGLSPSFLLLVEQGRRTPDPETMERIARHLELEDDLWRGLLAWSRLRRSRESADVVDAVRELSPWFAPELPEPGESSRPLRRGGPKEDEVLADPDPRSRPEGWRARFAATPRGSPPRRATHSIPLVPEGVVPGLSRDLHALSEEIAPGYTASDAAAIEISASLLEPGDSPIAPFAWRLSRRSTERLTDLLHEGDVIVLSRLRPPRELRHDDVWLVDVHGTPALARVVRDADSLLLLAPSAAGPGTEILRPDPASPDRRLLAKVVAAIRTWPGRARRP